jgi:hypothetical protein
MTPALSFRSIRRLALLPLALSVAIAPAALAQNGDDPKLTVPFKVGEKLTFKAKVNFMNAGTATMHVADVSTVNGTQAFHTIFDLEGKVVFKRVDNHYESWFDTRTLSSLKHVQRVDDGGEKVDKSYTFDHARKIYIRNGEERPGVAQPIEEGSFLYYVRSLPLEVGRTYTIHRYYRADRNPVVVKVLRRERVKVPAGEYDAIVVQPSIKSRGLFGEDSKAEVWLTDDASRTPVKLRSKLPVGTLYLELRSIEHTSGR